jgi:hypothetical protein
MHGHHYIPGFPTYADIIVVHTYSWLTSRVPRMLGNGSDQVQLDALSPVSPAL